MPNDRCSTFKIYKPEEDGEPAAENEFLKRAKRYQDAIHEVLMSEWDPIGFGGAPKAQDTYDQYINHICGMLVRRESRNALTDFLWWAETEDLGFYGTLERTEQTADSLLKIIEQDQGTE
jgi:hypothetical protein